MSYLISSLRTKERNDAFITIGLLSIAVDGSIKPYLARIMELIRASLPGKVLIKPTLCYANKLTKLLYDIATQN